MPTLAQPFSDLLITTVDNGPFFINDLFKRKFAGIAPDYGASVICFYRQSATTFMPLCYSNFLQYEEVILVAAA